MSITRHLGRQARVRGLLGRGDERALLDALVDDVAGGTSRVLVIRGEAGVGKSALLDYLCNQLDAWRLTSAVGVQSEMELAFSGLQQLCAPLLSHLDALPGPQRDALATLFGLVAGPPPGRFHIGLATRSLLAAAAEHQPLLCRVDDGQWLDQSTAKTLAFVARRLANEPVALVCAARSGAGDGVLAGVPDMTLTGLRDEDARELLLSNLHAPMDASVCDRIIAESHGNPLALLELPRSWTAMDLAGGFGLPSHQSIASKIEESYLRRLQLLPDDTQLLVLTAAADPLGDPVLLNSAVQALGITMTAATPAVDQGLIRVRARVEFAHPLVRSATYYSADEATRHRAHSALADATDPDADPDRRAWHRAQATGWPDDEVADDLERSATRARARGGLPAAAAFLTRATELTPQPSRRSERALRAAVASVQAGAFDAARRLVNVAREARLDDSQEARLDLLGGQLALASSRGKEAVGLLLAAAARLEPIDMALARETYLTAFTAALFASRLSDGADVAAIAKAASATPHPATDRTRTPDLLLDAYCAMTESYRAAAPKCRDVLRELCADMTSDANRRWLWHGTVLALELWDDDSAYRLATQHVEWARTSGALSELALALSAAIPVFVLCGETHTATAAVDEARFVEDAAGISEAPYGALMLGAWLGNDAAQTKDLVEDTLAAVTARGEGIGIAVSEYAHAVLCNGLGQYDEAVAAASRAAADPRELVAHNWGLTELVEAAARAGRKELAAQALHRLVAKTDASGTDWALGIEARSRAILADDSDAEHLYRRAIDHLVRTRANPELGRAQLLYGEWLRRTNRRTDARQALKTAHEIFTSHHLEAFAERARRELVATGATVRKRNVTTLNDLTPQEAQITQLARTGLSNSEIGAQLFLSARTVEWHMGKVLAKLGITSRRQLRDAIPEQRHSPARA